MPALPPTLNLKNAQTVCTTVVLLKKITRIHNLYFYIIPFIRPFQVFIQLFIFSYSKANGTGSDLNANYLFYFCQLTIGDTSSTTLFLYIGVIFAVLISLLLYIILRIATIKSCWLVWPKPSDFMIVIFFILTDFYFPISLNHFSLLAFKRFTDETMQIAMTIGFFLICLVSSFFHHVCCAVSTDFVVAPGVFWISRPFYQVLFPLLQFPLISAVDFFDNKILLYTAFPAIMLYNIFAFLNIIQSLGYSVGWFNVYKCTFHITHIGQCIAAIFFYNQNIKSEYFSISLLITLPAFMISNAIYYFVNGRYRKLVLSGHTNGDYSHLKYLSSLRYQNCFLTYFKEIKQDKQMIIQALEFYPNDFSVYLTYTKILFAFNDSPSISEAIKGLRSVARNISMDWLCIFFFELVFTEVEQDANTLAIMEKLLLSTSREYFDVVKMLWGEILLGRQNYLVALSAKVKTKHDEVFALMDQLKPYIGSFNSYKHVLEQITKYTEIPVTTNEFQSLKATLQKISAENFGIQEEKEKIAHLQHPRHSIQVKPIHLSDTCDSNPDLKSDKTGSDLTKESSHFEYLVDHNSLGVIKITRHIVIYTPFYLTIFYLCFIIYVITTDLFLPSQIWSALQVECNLRGEMAAAQFIRYAELMQKNGCHDLEEKMKQLNEGWVLIDFNKDPLYEERIRIEHFQDLIMKYINAINAITSYASNLKWPTNEGIMHIMNIYGKAVTTNSSLVPFLSNLHKSMNDTLLGAEGDENYYIHINAKGVIDLIDRYNEVIYTDLKDLAWEIRTKSKITLWVLIVGFLLFGVFIIHVAMKILLVHEVNVFDIFMKIPKTSISEMIGSIYDESFSDNAVKNDSNYHIQMLKKSLSYSEYPSDLRRTIVALSNMFIAAAIMSILSLIINEFENRRTTLSFNYSKTLMYFAHIPSTYYMFYNDFYTFLNTEDHEIRIQFIKDTTDLVSEYEIAVADHQQLPVNLQLQSLFKKPFKTTTGMEMTLSNTIMLYISDYQFFIESYPFEKHLCSDFGVSVTLDRTFDILSIADNALPESVFEKFYNMFDAGTNNEMLSLFVMVFAVLVYIFFAQKNLTTKIPSIDFVDGALLTAPLRHLKSETSFMDVIVRGANRKEKIPDLSDSISTSLTCYVILCDRYGEIIYSTFDENISGENLVAFISRISRTNTHIEFPVTAKKYMEHQVFINGKKLFYKFCLVPTSLKWKGHDVRLSCIIEDITIEKIRKFTNANEKNRLDLLMNQLMPDFVVKKIKSGNTTITREVKHSAAATFILSLPEGINVNTVQQKISDLIREHPDMTFFGGSTQAFHVVSGIRGGKNDAGRATLNAIDFAIDFVRWCQENEVEARCGVVSLGNSISEIRTNTLSHYSFLCAGLSESLEIATVSPPNQINMPRETVEQIYSMPYNAIFIDDRSLSGRHTRIYTIELGN